MTIHPNDQARTAATSPDRGVRWGIPVIVVAGVLLAGLFAFKSMEAHNGMTTIPITRADRLTPAPADAATAGTPVVPGGTQ